MIVTLCDICGDGTRAGRTVVRFSLVRTAYVAGKKTSRGAGVLFVCSDCWARTAKKLMRRKSAKASA